MEHTEKLMSSIAEMKEEEERDVDVESAWKLGNVSDTDEEDELDSDGVKRRLEPFYIPKLKFLADKINLIK
jgi:hypothetical protein